MQSEESMVWLARLIVELLWMGWQVIVFIQPNIFIPAIFGSAEYKSGQIYLLLMN